MDKKTLTALKGSIKKWEKIVAGTGADLGTENCPLCKLFFKFPIDCEGCPVMVKTGHKGCRDTPYDYWDGEQPPYSETQSEVAAEELKFLRSLLPSAAR